MKNSNIKFSIYCFDIETSLMDLNCVKIIKKDCGMLIKHNSICLPNYTKE